MTEFNPRYLNNLSMKRPHLVLLGAGASRAACPKGDRNGRQLPVMADLAEVVGLNPLLDSAEIDSDRSDFEALYSALAADPSRRQLVTEIENRVFEYFSSLELPQEPTLYDYLVLSLREKDVIATFNWDPFLIQARIRNQHVGGMPHTLFLHGNVGIGHCKEHAHIVRHHRCDTCPKCDTPLDFTPLLFPNLEKDYQKDPFIAECWEFMEQELKAAYLLTIFGYSAPDTDIGAVNLLKGAWDPDASRQFKTMEIIDIREEDDLRDTWCPFFPTSYYQFHKGFDGSLLCKYPRRTCESKFGIELDGFEYAKQAGRVEFPQKADWDELHAWFAMLSQAEPSAAG